MSATLAGICKKCNKDYYISFGHPKWFNDGAYKGIDSPEFRAYKNLRKVKICTKCDQNIWKEFIKKIASDDFWEDIVKLLNK